VFNGIERFRAGIVPVGYVPLSSNNPNGTEREASELTVCLSVGFAGSRRGWVNQQKKRSEIDLAFDKRLLLLEHSVRRG
jgi:hypothetical protein